jgi:hypothetical protein
MSKLFFAMRGITAALPSNPPKQAYPPSGNPQMYLFIRGRAKKVVTILNNVHCKRVIGLQKMM